MRQIRRHRVPVQHRFSTLQCGSWIDAFRTSTTGSGQACFSTLQCGSWIDAPTEFRQRTGLPQSFSTLQCGSWIDAGLTRGPRRMRRCFSTLQCGSWIDAGVGASVLLRQCAVSVPFNAGRGLMPPGSLVVWRRTTAFQYPSMRVVD